MTPGGEKRLLQVVVAILGLVPLLAGASGVIAGAGFVLDAPAWPVDLDSHFRYLSGIFLALGVTFYACIPAIERRGGLFRIAAAMVVAGGVARLVSLLVLGAPSPPHLAGLGMELIVVPLLALWQARVARRVAQPAA